MGFLRSFGRVVLPVVGGAVIGKLTAAESKEDYKEFKQPPFAPPSKAFPIVWPLLYMSMGVGYELARRKGDDDVATSHYSQLALNYLWSLLYFKYKLRGTALIESYCLLLAVMWTTFSFYRANKTSGIILVPYVLWVSFASYLTTGSWLLNKDNPKYE